MTYPERCVGGRVANSPILGAASRAAIFFAPARHSSALNADVPSATDFTLRAFPSQAGGPIMDFLARYNIAVNPVGISNAAAKKKYTRQVTEHLTWIYRTRTGRILLNSIKFHGRPVEIQPYTVGDCNASGGGQIVAGAMRGFVRYSPDTFSLHGACPA